MKTLFFILMVALTVAVVADEPKLPSALAARHIYEKELKVADEERLATLQAAKSEALTKLQAGLDAAQNRKYLKEANAIGKAMKLMMESSVLEDTGFRIINNVKKKYESSIVAASNKYGTQVNLARTRYLTALEAALYATSVETDLDDAIRIDAVIERLRKQLVITNSIGMSFRLMPDGPSGEFSIGVHEVTQSQCAAVMGANPSAFKGANLPVVNVSWDDAALFCRKLSDVPAERAAGRVYTLPSEEEWEFACRAGTTTEYSFGVDELVEYAWFDENSGDTPHAVGEKLPNGRGL